MPPPIARVPVTIHVDVVLRDRASRRKPRDRGSVEGPALKAAPHVMFVNPARRTLAPPPCVYTSSPRAPQNNAIEGNLAQARRSSQLWSSLEPPECWKFGFTRFCHRNSRGGIGSVAGDRKTASQTTVVVGERGDITKQRTVREQNRAWKDKLIVLKPAPSSPPNSTNDSKKVTLA